jgi:hypothetical protein
MMKLLRGRAAALVLASALVLAFSGGAAGEENPVNPLSEDGYIRHWVLLGPFPSTELDEPAAGGVTRSGYHTDYLESLGGEPDAAARQAMDELRARGHEPTGEVRDVVLHDFRPGEGVLWEVTVVLGEPSRPAAPGSAGD